MFFFLIFSKLCLGILLLVLCVQNTGAQKINIEYFSTYDLPRQSDLEKYVTVLKNITNFYSENINKISISVAFGIFLGNVYMEHALKYVMVKSNWKADLIDIYIKSDGILKYYQWKIADEDGEECVKISKLFTNTSIWVDRVEKFKPPRKSYKTSKDFKRYYHSWRKYLFVVNVRRANQWIPSPKESDYCLKLLAGSQKVDGVCLLDNHCYRVVNRGSDIGYALCHRALLLLMAKNSRDCNILSPLEDTEMLDSFCSMSYAEVEYIAHHNYGLVDLMMEHVSLCALHGRTEFLRRDWLNNILQFQTSYGCFSQDITKTSDSNDLLDGRCSGHTTALATSVYAAAVRYILEIY